MSSLGSTADKRDTDSSSTRRRMVRAAAALMQARGYHGAGVAEILARAQAPRGSLYHHFPGGKRQIAVEAVALSARLFVDDLEAAAQGASSLDDYLDRLVALSGRDLAQSDYEAACPVAATALDVPQEETAVVAACAETFALWEAAIIGGFARFVSDPDRARAAGMVASNALLGVTVVARAARDTGRIDALVGSLRKLVAG